MRVFVRLRSLLAAHADLARRLDELERRYDDQFRAVFDAIRQLMPPPDPPRRPIGFTVRERRAAYRCSRSSGARAASKSTLGNLSVPASLRGKNRNRGIRNILARG
jgi:hypothetical protein